MVWLYRNVYVHRAAPVETSKTPHFVWYETGSVLAWTGAAHNAARAVATLTDRATARALNRNMLSSLRETEVTDITRSRKGAPSSRPERTAENSTEGQSEGDLADDLGY